MNAIILETGIILLLILTNGLFAMAEIAIVSARRSRLQQWAGEGDARAQAALDLADTPGRFLSTVQIGITLVGIFAGAFGGATLAEELAVRLNRVPLVEPYDQVLAVGLVILLITYLSLVFGELAPKRLALHNAERVAMIVAFPMGALSRLASPIVRLLSFSTELTLRALGVEPTPKEPVTEEEIKILIGQGTRLGVFEPEEEEMVERVFRLADRRVSALVTPRPEVIWFDENDSPEEIRNKVVLGGHSHFPVARGSLDQVLGLVKAKDLLAQSLVCEPLDLKAALQPALFVPEGAPALEVLERFRETRLPIALVVDEYGGLVGLVTLKDFLEAIVGDIPEKGREIEPEVVQRKDGSWLVDGMLPIDEFKALFEIKELPNEAEVYYQTLGGFVMTFLGRIPATAESFDWGGLRFEVVDMDGLRVDKVLVVPAPQEPDDVG